MNAEMKDKFNGEGGTFTVNNKGVREQVETASDRHADGDRAREADGTPIDQPVQTVEPALPPPAPAPWATKAKAQAVAEKKPAAAAADPSAPKSTGS